jgi:hypothetical protein
MDVRRDSTGRVDRQALEATVTREAMRDWLRARLAGHDLYLPLDTQDLEAPTEVFVEVWQDAEPRGHLREAFGLACNDLLREAWEKTPAEAWVAGLLDLLAIVRPPLCQAVLGLITARPDFPEVWRTASLDLAWLRATASYPHQEPRLIPVWVRLLQDRRCAAIAFNALAQDPLSAAFHLPAYFRGLRAHERAAVVRKALTAMFRRSADETRASLELRWAEFGSEQGLQEAVSKALADIGQPEVPVGYSSASALRSPSPGPDGGSSVWDGIAALPAEEKVAA